MGLVGVVAALGAGACSIFEGGQGDGGALEAPLPTPTEEGTVVVANTSYSPPEITTPAGEEVTWTFSDGGLAHTVTADDGSFDSGRKTSGQFTQAFTEAGEVTYHCEVHASMEGTVLVVVGPITEEGTGRPTNDEPQDGNGP